MQRDDKSADEVLSIMNNQWDEDEKIQKSRTSKTQNHWNGWSVGFGTFQISIGLQQKRKKEKPKFMTTYEKRYFNPHRC